MLCTEFIPEDVGEGFCFVAGVLGDHFYLQVQCIRVYQYLKYFKYLKYSILARIVENGRSRGGDKLRDLMAEQRQNYRDNDRGMSR